MKAKTLVLTALGALVLAAPAFARLEARDFRKLVGYTVIEITNVVGDFEGADFDKTVVLDNGMVLGSASTTTRILTAPMSLSWQRR